MLGGVAQVPAAAAVWVSFFPFRDHGAGEGPSDSTLSPAHSPAASGRCWTRGSAGCTRRG